MKMKNSNLPLVLCIMDGWGISKVTKNNAVKLAKTPNFDFFLKKYPNCKLTASGENVGLPANQIGNSEVGHMNIGAGRIVTQSLPKINKSISNNEFCKNKNDNGRVRTCALSDWRLKPAP